ncbi:PrgI family protein [Candidatus Saccharibacteria bacterium]|nr:PrgI family protein [Candidatus Saccharibacteria bacterium]
MAQYKVPQDVEADDKLLGPFSFRQFVYLLIAGGLIALAVGLFQLFPLLAIIPVPFVLLLAALALPLKKDQPMETYLAAIVSYYLKPRTRLWVPGQKETTIDITAPKMGDEENETRSRDITGEEATHRLSFLADIVDTEGYAIKGTGAKRMNEDLVMEANTANDIFENNHFDSLENTIARDENAQREKVMQEMREAIKQNEQMTGVGMQKEVDNSGAIVDSSDAGSVLAKPDFESSVIVTPGSEVATEMVEKSNAVSKKAEENMQRVEKSSIIELANNLDFSVATISKEAKRLKERDEGEVFISLH